MNTTLSRVAIAALLFAVSMLAQGPLSVRVRDLGGSAAPTGACESGARYTQTGVTPIIWTCGSGLTWVKGAQDNVSSIDIRPLLSIPSILAAEGANGGTGASSVLAPWDLNLGATLNLWRYTEDISHNPTYGTVNATVDGATSVVWNGITLKKFTSGNYYGRLQTNLSGLGLALFTAGNCYLQSAYVQNLKDVEQFVYLRSPDDSVTFRHGRRLVTPAVRRIWGLFRANTQYHLDAVANPAIAYGSGTNANPNWVAVASTGGDGTVDLRIGGIQVEEVPCEKQGIAVIGDSTTAQNSAHNDASWTAWTAIAGGLLNVNFFNRAIGGQTTAQSDARWATDISPLAVNASHVIIQGGINDIGQGRTLAEIQTSIESMNAKAIADGMTPVFTTITPFSNSCSTPSMETLRGQVNSWLKATYPYVLDIASIVADPHMPNCLRRDPEWYGDGTHFGQNANRAIGEYIAHSYVGNLSGNPQVWSFRRPSFYQPVLATTPTRGRLLVGQPIAQTVGATLASSATIAPTAGITSVSGTTTIDTITLPYTGFTGCLKLVPTDAWATSTAGNIQIATTATVSRVLEMCWTGSKWFPSY
jgi:lysophospholipase L1-like esterase